MTARPPATDPLRSLRLFVGAATPAECRVYAEVDADDAADLTLSGQITGPYCPYAQTLSATQRLVDRGPGPTLLAEARVAEACFWTPEFPYLYEVEVNLSRAGEQIASTRRLFGMRWFAAEGVGLLCERQPWLVGAARVANLTADDLDAFRDSNLAAITAPPSEAICAAASRQGVILVAEVALSGSALELELRRLAQWPAVVMAVLPGNTEVTPAARRAAGNLLLVQDAAGDTRAAAEIALAPWAQIALVRSPNVNSRPLTPNLSRAVPYLVMAAEAAPRSMPQVRASINAWHEQRTADAAATAVVLPAGYVIDLRGAQ